MNTPFSLRNLPGDDNPNPVCILRSREWEGHAGLSHGFTTRIGGGSKGPYASFNLGRSVNDDPQNVEANWSRLYALTGVSAESWISARQIHSNRLLWVSTVADCTEISGREADAVATDLRGVCAHVRTADCVPILLVSRKARIAAAVHAGWRGTVQNIAKQSVAAIQARNPQANDIEALVGPSIGPCCFEVGSGVAAQFAPQFVAGKEHARVDLWRANATQLEEAGVAPSRIAVAKLCTICNPKLFFSHRRDKGITGRMVAWAGWVE